MPVSTRSMTRTAMKSDQDFMQIKNIETEKVASEEISDSSLEEWKISSHKGKGKGISNANPPSKALDTVISILNQKEEERSTLLYSTIRKTCCRKCGAMGEWVRGKKDPKNGTWIWSCGTFTTSGGCSRTISQGLLIANALGVVDLKQFKKDLPKGVYGHISNLDVHPIKNPTRISKRPLDAVELTIEMPEGVAKKPETTEIRIPIREDVKSWIENVRALLTAAINIAKQATSLEEAKTAFEIIDKARMFLDRADALSELERTRTMSLYRTETPKVATYACVAGRGVTPKKSYALPTRITAEQIEAKTSDQEARRKMACDALAWKKKAPISKRMLKGGEKLEEGPLKKNIDSMEFIYVEGIARMKHGMARSMLRTAGVDTRAIKDISFIGGRVCSLLADKTSKGDIMKALVFEGSPLRVIEDFDPMSKEHYKRSLPPAQLIDPVDLYIKRAALAVANNRRLEIATKYQHQLPAEHQEKLRQEVQKILEKRNKPKKFNETSLAVPLPVNDNGITAGTEDMETEDDG